MVFGWGKKKREETPAESIPREKEVKLSDVEKIVDELCRLRESQCVSEIKHLRNSTQPLIDDLIKIGNVLENDDLNVDDIDKHIAIIVVRGKKQVISAIKKDVVHLPDVSSLDDAKKLNTSLNQTLKKVGDVLGRQTRVIHIFAKKYASRLKENLEVMDANHSEIQTILKNLDSGLLISNEIYSALEKISSLRQTRTEKSKKIADMEENIQSNAETVSSLQKSINSIKNSENYQRFIDMRNKVELFSSEKSKIKNQIDAQFTKISRPLSRYAYSSSLDKEQKNILADLAENPIDALLSENKDSVIVILENVRKGVTSGSISVKDLDKTLSQITETEESLDGFILQLSKHAAELEQMQNELASLKPENLMSLEAEYERSVQNRNDMQTKVKTAQEEIGDINLQIPDLISGVEKRLREFSNTKYTVISS